MKLTYPLVDAILAGLVTRFAEYSEREDLILASITLPQFRMWWLDEVKKERTRALYESVDRLEQTVERASESGSVSVSVSQKDEFFCFDSLSTENTDA